MNDEEKLPSSPRDDANQQFDRMPSSQRHHARTVSFDQEALIIMERAKKRIQLNRMGQSQTRLTLDGLLGTNHYENEATTHILKGLDERGAAIQANTDMAFDASAIMPSINQDVNDSLRDTLNPAPSDPSASTLNSRNSASSERRRLLCASKSHRRLQSVDEQLAGLAADLFAVDQNGSIDGEDNPAALTERGDFFKNTGRVLEQFSKSHRHLFSTNPDALMNDVSATDETTVNGDDSNKFDIENPTTNEQSDTNQGQEKPHGSGPSNFFRKAFGAADQFKEDLDAWGSIFNPTQKHSLKRYLAKAFLYIILPMVGIAALLFYAFENPPSSAGGTQASASWWLLFVARQVTTFSIALTLQRVIVDFLCVGTRIIPKILGPVFTLLIVQSKGWPFVVFCWALLDFAVLYGDHPFAAHWLYWQDWVGLFNEENPGGQVISNPWNRFVLLVGMFVPIAAALKRFIVGLFLGRQSYMHYGEPLAKVMSKMLLVGEVAALGRRRNSNNSTVEAEVSKIADRARSIPLSASFDESEKQNNVGAIPESERPKLMHFLDRWEEPERMSVAEDNASIAAVLKFRNALTLIRNRYPFSYAFGLASTRAECVESAQEVYGRLLLLSNDPTSDMLSFETLALAALDSHGLIDDEKASDLVRVFRPNRDGSLSLVDFVKSVDAVYKEFRLLQASIENASQIDRAFEGILNVVFYAIVGTVIMAALGLNPLAMFLSLSSVILAFAFMIGSASSKYFEGLLFILVRRPYGIGDLINVNGIDEMTGFMGSIGWTVQKVTLYETTMTWLPTMETCTVANGALASSRIVNWARSPHARFVIFLYFPIETTYETIDLFRHAVEEYMKARPREWLAFNALRVLGIYTDKSYIHLELVVQHREAWQNPGAIYDSRGNLVSYCNEVQKLLGMQYTAPPLPIDIRAGSTLPAQMMKDGAPPNNTTAGDSSSSSAASSEDQNTILGEKFRHAAQNKHKMFF